MPTFYKDVEAEVDVDIEEFVDECSDREIQILIRYMVEEGKLPKTLTGYEPSQNLSVNETIWYETIEKIRSNRLTLTDEEIDIIENIAKRF
jgi:hypothetical protein